MGQQSETNGNVVSSGAKLKRGTDNLLGVSQKVTAQFNDGGEFKNGMIQVATGTNKLVQSSCNLSNLQIEINNINDSLSQFKIGSTKLYNGSKIFNNGLVTAQNGSKTLQNGSGNLATGSSVLDNLNSDKNDKTAIAFDKTFLISAIILAIASIFGIFTDKKIKIKNEL